jgi:UPF0755 protein
MPGPRRATILAAVLLVAGGGGFALYHVAAQRFTGPGPLIQPRTVLVPHGTPTEVADVLQADGVIADARAFRIAALLTRGEGNLHAAELAFPAAASLRQVLGILRGGHPVQHRVTIPEGLTAAQIALLLDRAEALGGDAALPDEGAMLPQSYSYERGATRTSVVERASAAMQHSLALIWAERAGDLPLATPAELLTLASIVERETARPEERPHVASVLLNRLKRGMKLQSDPTVAYAATGGMATADPSLTRAELDAPNPYNTYQAAGLPPGPIGSPGIAALRAVAHPAVTDDLYYVADGTGGHSFARTLDEHNRNVARWRAASAAK